MSNKKLNLGSGDKPLDGYVNIDIKDGRTAYPLDVADNSCSEIRASHLLEHFGHGMVYKVVKHWTDKLADGGILKLAVPDFGKLASLYVKGEKLNYNAYICGGQVDQDDCHYSIFDESSLREIMQAVGLTDIQNWSDESGDCSSLPISLNLAGKKKMKQQNDKISKKIAAVISMPRLGFTLNSRSMIQSLALRRIPVQTGTGAFWDQVLTRTIEQQLESEKPDYLLTLDYDTWFTYDHIIGMLKLAEFTGADVIVPAQQKRDSGDLLALARQGATPEQKQAGVIPIRTGHFGCTLFRADVFDRIELPWFKPVPGPDGRWNDGRVDSDIYFWHNCEKAGIKVLLSTNIEIGHIQQVVTFPGDPPLHCYVSDIEAGKIPEHITNKLKEI